MILFQIRSLDDPCKDVDGHREDDGAVVLRRDGAQRLKIPQLEASWLSAFEDTSAGSIIVISVGTSPGRERQPVE